MASQELIVRIRRITANDPINPDFIAWLKTLPPLPRKGRHQIAQIA